MPGPQGAYPSLQRTVPSGRVPRLGGVPPIVHDPDHHRFVTEVDGSTAELVYHRRGDRVDLAHTGVPPAIEGRGIGGRLVAAALAWAGAEGFAVVPSCPFVASWLAAHPETARAVRVATVP